MKKLIIIIIAVISFPIFSQQQHSFTYENNQLEWVKVFESSLSQSEIEQIVSSKGMFKKLNVEDNLVKGEIENIKCDFETLGKSSWTTSFYIQNTNMNFSFYINFKDGRYRVIVNDIKLKTIDELSTGDLTIASSNAINPLTYYAIRKGKFRKGFLKSDVEIYEYTLTNLFNFNNYNKKTEDW